MKYCMHCGSEMSDKAEFCGNCGKAVNSGGKDNIELMQSVVQNFQKSRSSEKEERKIKGAEEMFVNPDEVQKAVLGGGYLANMIRTGTMSKGFGVLTNRRFYFKGKCFYKVGNHFMKTDEERTVDLQDITSSGFTYTRLFLWNVIAVLGMVLFVLLGIYSGSDSKKQVVAILFGVIDIVFWLIFILFKRAIYEISFAGGSIAIKASSYGMKEIKAFDKKLRLAKDEYLAERKS